MSTQTLNWLIGKASCSYAGQCWPEQSSRRARYSKRCSKGEQAGDCIPHVFALFPVLVSRVMVMRL